MTERAITAMIWAGVSVRVALAVWNATTGPIFGSDADAINFHRFATGVARGDIRPGTPMISFAFAYALGLIYRMTGPSQLVGSLISCAAWWFSAVVFRRILTLLSVPATALFAAVATYALLPSSAIWTSTTLREPYQLVCVNLIALGALRLLSGGGRWAWLVLIAATLTGFFLHAAVFLTGSVAIVVVGIVRALRRPGGRSRAAVGVTAVLISAGLAATAVAMQYSPYLGVGLEAGVTRYLEAGLAQFARTAYFTTDQVQIGGAGDFARFAALSFWRYLVEPLPWHVSTWHDAVLLIENALRAMLLVLALVALPRLQRDARLKVVVLIGLYLTLERFWSFGTLNWGTAARHHLTASGLLFAAAAAIFHAGRVWRPAQEEPGCRRIS